MNCTASIQRGYMRMALPVALLLVAGFATQARAQDPGDAPPPPPTAAAEDFSRPMGPRDPFNRGTPRGSMHGYLTAARARDYQRAAEYLELRRLPPAKRGSGPLLARRLQGVLDQTLWVDLRTLSDSETGTPDDGLPSWQDRIGDIETTAGTVSFLMQRVPRAGDGTRIWKSAPATVAMVEELHSEFEPLWLEEWLPAVFFEHEIFGNG